MRCQAVTSASQAGEKLITRCERDTDDELCYYHSKIDKELLKPSNSAIEIQANGRQLWPRLMR